MSTILSTRSTAIHRILESLGLSPDKTEQCAVVEGYRIDFEKNFTVELQSLADLNCRASARIFRLGKSLQVQESQIKMALILFAELKNEMPNNVSTAISNHDNCLRLCIEIMDNVNNDNVLNEFQEFVHIAFAYKQTYFQHKGGQG